MLLHPGVVENIHRDDPKWLMRRFAFISWWKINLGVGLLYTCKLEGLEGFENANHDSALKVSSRGTQESPRFCSATGVAVARRRSNHPVVRPQWFACWLGLLKHDVTAGYCCISIPISACNAHVRTMYLRQRKMLKYTRSNIHIQQYVDRTPKKCFDVFHFVWKFDFFYLILLSFKKLLCFPFFSIEFLDSFAIDFLFSLVFPRHFPPHCNLRLLMFDIPKLRLTALDVGNAVSVFWPGMHVVANFFGAFPRHPVGSTTPVRLQTHWPTSQRELPYRQMIANIRFFFVLPVPVACLRHAGTNGVCSVPLDTGTCFKTYFLPCIWASLPLPHWYPEARYRIRPHRLSTQRVGSPFGLLTSATQRHHHLI